MADTKTSTKSTRRSTPAKPAKAKKPASPVKARAPAKEPAKARPAVSKVVAKAAAPRRTRAAKPKAIGVEQRRNYIEMAAYYIAERRGFAPGNPLQDWVEAEAEIDRLLAEGRLGG